MSVDEEALSLLTIEAIIDEVIYLLSEGKECA